MRIKRYEIKLTTVAIVAVFIAVLLLNFDKIFTDINCNAFSESAGNKADVTVIPSKINFLDDDKKSFLNYCKKIYGNNFPLKIDESVYKYYGTVNGYRLYRLQLSYISFDSIIEYEDIDGYIFESPCRFRPERTGLYIIGDTGVFTLNDAYKLGYVDISKIYRLYTLKST